MIHSKEDVDSYFSPKTNSVDPGSYRKEILIGQQDINKEMKLVT
jgi:hypothetical protein